MVQWGKDSWACVWFYILVVGCLFFSVTTYFNDYIDTLLPFLAQQQFNLAVENNFATWWSGLLLFLITLHASDGFFAKKSCVPLESRGWAAIALIFAIFSLDEIGSLHERASQLVHLGGVWWSLLPFAIVVLFLMFYSFYAFYKSKVSYKRLLLLVIGFGLLSSVVLQEFLEHIVVWEPWMKPLRRTVEEGSELLGMLFLLKACMPNTHGVFNGKPGTSPVFEITSLIRNYLFYLSILVSPIVVYVTVLWSQDQPAHFQGHPADWLAAGLFLFAGLAIARRFLRDGIPMNCCEMALVAACLFGSCSSVALPPNYKIFLPMMTVSIRMLAFFCTVLIISALWTFGNCRWQNDRRFYGLTILVLAIASLFTVSGFIQYGSPILLGALVYRANSEEARLNGDNIFQGGSDV